MELMFFPSNSIANAEALRGCVLLLHQSFTVEQQITSRTTATRYAESVAESFECEHTFTVPLPCLPPPPPGRKLC